MGLIGTALGAVGSIFGGIKASKAMKKYKKDLEKQRSENESWYNRRYNEDATQRADAQALLTRVGEALRQRNRTAMGTQAVMGGTEESVAATKAANNEALAQAATNIAVNGEARKSAVESQYFQREDDIRNKQNGLEVKRAENIAGAVKGVLGASGDMDFGELKLKNGKTLDL